MEGADQSAGTTLRVNPEGLRRFADNLRTESGAVTGLNADDGFHLALAALPGTEFGAATQQATDVVDRCLRRIGERLTKIADSTQNAAKAYEVAEDDFTSRLETIGLRLS
ncbi:type VII secretion target [Nocardia sp. NPDC005366]|uniref:type VII secretion target n=1 Tax=Nocardia sp. NPDC005366 TaxID=3156878 RepID=UPI0033B6FF39